MTIGHRRNYLTAFAELVAVVALTRLKFDGTEIMSELAGKVVAITGASSGIGEAVARHLAQHGAKVMLGARRTDRLNEITAELGSAGGAAESQALDVTKRADVADFVKRTQERFGRLDVFVSNAGLMPLSLPDVLKVDEWDRIGGARRNTAS